MEIPPQGEFSAPFTGGTDMTLKVGLALFTLLLLGVPSYAQSLCVKCLNAAQVELKKCLDAAISTEDKISCSEKKEARSQACEDGECKIERTQGGSKPDVPVEKK
jgi:hypothetical protein